MFRGTPSTVCLSKTFYGSNLTLIGNRKEEANPGSGWVLVGKWDYQQFNESQEMHTTQKLSLKYYIKRPSSPTVTVCDA